MVPRTAIQIDAIPATSASPNSHSMSSTSSNSLIGISPLYNCLSNYNKTLIVRRSSDLSIGAIDIFGPYEPQDLLPIFVTIIYKQFKENCELQTAGRLRQIEYYELQDTDDNDVNVNVKKDHKGDDKDDKRDHEDDGDDEDNHPRCKRQRKAADDHPTGRGGSCNRGRGRNRGGRGRTHNGDERTGHQKDGSSGGASNMSSVKQDEMWMPKPGNRLYFVHSLLFR